MDSSRASAIYLYNKINLSVNFQLLKGNTVLRTLRYDVLHEKLQLV